MRVTFAARAAATRLACSLDTKPRIARNAFVVLWRARREGEIRELVNDHLWRRGTDSARERFRIENIDHDRLGPERAHAVRLIGRPRGADDSMSDRAQQRRELAPDRPACTGQKYFHRGASIMSRS